jgi:NitT/TauT family transport system substrate-binding protein
MKRADVLKGSAAAAVAALPRPLRAANPDVVRFVAVPADADADFYAAKQMGFLAKAGISPEVIALANGSAAIEALVSGTFEVGGVNILSLARAREKGILLQPIALGPEYNTAKPTAAIMVASDSAFHSARDLNNRIVAVNELKSIAQIATQAWIDKNGGDSSTIKFVELPFRAAQVALTQRRVDAAFVSEPFVTMSKTDCRSIGKPYDGIATHFSISGWVCRDEWLRANIDVATRVHQALHEGSVWANRHHDETAQFMSVATDLDLSIMKASTRATFTEQLNLATTQQVLDVSLKYGALTTAMSAKSLFPATIWGPLS